MLGEAREVVSDLDAEVDRGSGRYHDRVAATAERPADEQHVVTGSVGVLRAVVAVSAPASVVLDRVPEGEVADQRVV